MEYIKIVAAWIASLNTIIEGIVISGGSWAYAIMFIILFMGAAFVVTAPILPSVSMIFLVTSLSVAGLLNPILSFLILVAAISLGDLTAYYTGNFVHNKFLSKYNLPFIKVEHFDKTKVIYDKADFLTIVFARFTPIIGSFAQFVAGAINYKIHNFISRNVIAGIIWLTFHFVAGWVFAVIPGLKNNFVAMFMIVPIISFFVSTGYYIYKNLDSLGLPGQKSVN